MACMPFSPQASVRSPRCLICSVAGSKRVHLRADVVRLRAEHVIDLAVAGRAHAVVGVVGQRKTGVECARGQLAARRPPGTAGCESEDKYCAPDSKTRIAHVPMFEQAPTLSRLQRLSWLHSENKVRSSPAVPRASESCARPRRSAPCRCVSPSSIRCGNQMASAQSLSFSGHWLRSVQRASRCFE